jgi:predicted nuclease with RNAse H fold
LVNKARRHAGSRRDHLCVITLGIDLAASDAKTACCEIDWAPRPAAVTLLEVGASDERLVALVSRAERVGIDCPLGWPDIFVEAVNRYQKGSAWPDVPRELMRFRRTDIHVAERGRWPLSVSTDRIGVTAMRCAALLTHLGVTARDGSDKIAEVYPAAALRAWEFDARGYKLDAGADKRRALVDGLRKRTALWLSIPIEFHALCVTSDHALDALLCALVARACALRLTEPAPPEVRPAAVREGWIHVPLGGSFDALPG